MALRIILPKLNFVSNTVNRRRFLHLTNYNQKLVQFVLSDIGEGIKEVTVKDWFVKVGDKVCQFDDICLVESDKASVNITSRYDGVVMKLHHEIGDTAFVGKALLDIDVPDESDVKTDLAELGESQEAKDTKSPLSKLEDEKEDLNERTRALATPAVRRIAAENNIKLQDIKGTGKGGRVMKNDILLHIDSKTSPTPQSEQISTSQLKSQDIPKRTPTVITLSGVKKAMSKAMTRANLIPSFGYSDEVNVSKLVALREEIMDFSKKQGSKSNFTYLPFLIKALSKSLEKFPELNARVDENGEIMTILPEHNIGIAVDTEDGLLVPNIKNVQDLSLTEVNVELRNLIERAKTRKLSVNDLTEGTFTISNIGILGGTYLKPVINPPEVGIVGIGKFRKKPIYDDNDQLVKAIMCNVSWTADHRVVDGATMARFANLWRDYIENPSYFIFDL